MNQSPEPPSHDGAVAPKTAYVTLLGMSLRKPTYLGIQATLIVTAAIVGLVLFLAGDAEIGPFKVKHIGVVLMVVALAEVGEMWYALKRKVTYRER